MSQWKQRRTGGLISGKCRLKQIETEAADLGVTRCLRISLNGGDDLRIGTEEARA